VRLSDWFYSFRDLSDRWWAQDKESHFGWGAALFAHGYLYGSPLRGFVEVGLAAVLVELAEVIRYQAWVSRGSPQPRPYLCDKISFKDLLIAPLGALAWWVVISL